MPQFDPASVGLGAVVVAVCSLLGLFVKRSTVIATKNIDDRSQQNRDLMFQVDFLWKKNDAQSRVIDQLQERDRLYFGTLKEISGNIRFLINSVKNLLFDFSSENCTREDLESQTKNIKEISVNLSESVRSAIKDIPNVSKAPKIDQPQKADIMDDKEEKNYEL